MGQLEFPEERSAMAKENLQGSLDYTTTWTSRRQTQQSTLKLKGIGKKLQEHWTNIPDTLKKQLEEMGIKGAEPAAPPDLPTLIKDHLESLPTVLKEEVEKIIQPTKMEPPVNQKLKQAVGTLKQLSEKKAAIQSKADAIKHQYTQLLNELKETQSKIETAQKELRTKDHKSLQPATRAGEAGSRRTPSRRTGSRKPADRDGQYWPIRYHGSGQRAGTKAERECYEEKEVWVTFTRFLRSPTLTEHREHVALT